MRDTSGLESGAWCRRILSVMAMRSSRRHGAHGTRVQLKMHAHSRVSVPRPASLRLLPYAAAAWTSYLFLAFLVFWHGPSARRAGLLQSCCRIVPRPGSAIGFRSFSTKNL